MSNVNIKADFSADKTKLDAAIKQITDQILQIPSFRFKIDGSTFAGLTAGLSAVEGTIARLTISTDEWKKRVQQLNDIKLTLNLANALKESVAVSPEIQKLTSDITKLQGSIVSISGAKAALSFLEELRTKVIPASDAFKLVTTSIEETKAKLATYQSSIGQVSPKIDITSMEAAKKSIADLLVAGTSIKDIRAEIALLQQTMTTMQGVFGSTKFKTGEFNTAKMAVGELELAIKSVGEAARVPMEWSAFNAIKKNQDTFNLAQVEEYAAKLKEAAKAGDFTQIKGTKDGEDILRDKTSFVVAFITKLDELKTRLSAGDSMAGLESSLRKITTELNNAKIGTDAYMKAINDLQFAKQKLAQGAVGIAEFGASAQAPFVNTRLTGNEETSSETAKTISQLEALRSSYTALRNETEIGSQQYDTLGEAIIKVNSRLESLNVTTGKGKQGIRELGEENSIAYQKIAASMPQVDVNATSPEMGTGDTTNIKELAALKVYYEELFSLIKSGSPRTAIEINKLKDKTTEWAKATQATTTDVQQLLKEIAVAGSKDIPIFSKAGDSAEITTKNVRQLKIALLETNKVLVQGRDSGQVLSNSMLGASTAAGGLGMAMRQTSYIVQDSAMFFRGSAIDWSMGFRSIANNIAPVAEGLIVTAREARKTGVSMKAMFVDAIKSGGGMILAISLVVTAVQALMQRSKEAKEQNDKLAKSFDDLSRSASGTATQLNVATQAHKLYKAEAEKEGSLESVKKDLEEITTGNKALQNAQKERYMLIKDSGEKLLYLKKLQDDANAKLSSMGEKRTATVGFVSDKQIQVDREQESTRDYLKTKVEELSEAIRLQSRLVASEEQYMSFAKNIADNGSDINEVLKTVLKNKYDTIATTGKIAEADKQTALESIGTIGFSLEAIRQQISSSDEIINLLKAGIKSSKTKSSETLQEALATANIQSNQYSEEIRSVLTQLGNKTVKEYYDYNKVLKALIEEVKTPRSTAKPTIIDVSGLLEEYLAFDTTKEIDTFTKLEIDTKTKYAKLVNNLDVLLQNLAGNLQKDVTPEQKQAMLALAEAVLPAERYDAFAEALKAQGGVALKNLKESLTAESGKWVGEITKTLQDKIIADIVLEVKTEIKGIDDNKITSDYQAMLEKNSESITKAKKDLLDKLKKENAKILESDKVYADLSVAIDEKYAAQLKNDTIRILKTYQDRAEATQSQILSLMNMKDIETQVFAVNEIVGKGQAWKQLYDITNSYNKLLKDIRTEQELIGESNEGTPDALKLLNLGKQRTDLILATQKAIKALASQEAEMNWQSFEAQKKYRVSLRLTEYALRTVSDNIQETFFKTGDELRKLKLNEVLDKLAIDFGKKALGDLFEKRLQAGLVAIFDSTQSGIANAATSVNEAVAAGESVTTALGALTDPQTQLSMALGISTTPMLSLASALTAFSTAEAARGLADIVKTGVTAVGPPTTIPPAPNILAPSSSKLKGTLQRSVVTVNVQGELSTNKNKFVAAIKQATSEYQTRTRSNS